MERFAIAQWVELNIPLKIPVPILNFDQVVLSKRVRTSLANANITTVAEISKMTKRQIQDIKGMGLKGYNELEETLRLDHGVFLE